MTASEGGQGDGTSGAGSVSASSVSASSGAGGGPLRLFGMPALVVLITNGLQWWHSSVETDKLLQETQNLRAARDKTVAEVQQLQREQAEGASRSIQSWLDQLLKFSQPEDKVMVLSALLSTTPDESVKVWAREQMKRLEGQIESRQSEAEEKLALAVRQAPATISLPTLFPPAEGPGPAGAGTAGALGHGGSTASGAGGGRNSPSGASAGSAALGTDPPLAVSRDPRVAAVQLAASNLERVRRAKKLLVDAERDPQLLQPKPAPLREVPPAP